MSLIIKQSNFSQEQIDLIKRTICKGASDDELELFLYLCKKTGLDPFVRQIYMIPRKSKDSNGNWVTVYQPLVSIDGYRLIAERTKSYSPGRESTYVYDKSGGVFSATAYLKKKGSDGTWHEIAATAFHSEYVQKAKDGPTKFWAEKPHLMLAKCAESLALRRAFPAELSGVYTEEEMGAAFNADEIVVEEAQKQVDQLAISGKPIIAQITSQQSEKTGDEVASDEEFKAYNDLFKRIMPEAKKFANDYLAKKEIVSAAMLSSKGINKLMASLEKYVVKEPAIEEEVPF